MDLTVSRALAGYAATQKTIPLLGPVADKTSAPQAIGSGDGKNFGAVVGEMAGAAIQNLRAGESKSLAGVAGQADVQSVVEALANARQGGGGLPRHSAHADLAAAVRERTRHMSAEAIMDLARSAIWVTLMVGGPAMTVALVVGLVIGLFQALTSIQELTLTFVPKIVAILLTLWVLADFMAAQLGDFFQGEIIDALSAI